MVRVFALSCEGEHFFLEPKDEHHLRNVLRLRIGDQVEVAFQGRVYSGRLAEEGILVDSLQKEEEEEATLYLAQGIPKGTKMETVIKGGTEVGVHGFIPWKARRCVADYQGKEEKKRLRFQEIAKSAAKQSKSPSIPQVFSPMTLEEILEKYKDRTPVFADEEETSRNLKDILPLDRKKYLLFIGPEGGISPEERNRLKEAGALGFSLGPKILRTETAGIVSAYLLLYERLWRS